MTTAVVDSPEKEQGLARWFLDTLVVEDGCAPEMDTVVLDMALPVGPVPLLHEYVSSKRRPWRLVARWVPDPHGETALVCIWVPQTGAVASAPRLEP